jgi:hypothetical protein
MDPAVKLAREVDRGTHRIRLHSTDYAQAT